MKTTFISYGGPDASFARKLNDALLERNVKTFFFEKDALPGERIDRVMRRGINEHDRVILVCSEASLERPGVISELTELLARESRDAGAEYLIPIRLDDYVFNGWAPERADLKYAVTNRVMPDFRDPEDFESGVASLLRALASGTSRQPTPEEPRADQRSEAAAHLRASRPYTPYPPARVERLESLTRKRAANQHQKPGARAKQRLQRKIDELVRELKQSPISGDVVVGCELVRILGKGSYGAVWQAKDVKTGDDRAVKVFDSDCLGIKTSLYHFRRGVRAMRHLDQAGDRPACVVQLLEAEQSCLAFSMPLLNGGDLTDHTNRGWSQKKKLAVFTTICEAVQFAHSRDVIHRDIKPANVVMHDGLPVLTDFDIADLLFAKSRSASGVGDVSYAAPEALRGGGRRERTVDVFGLGRLLHFLLTEEDPLIAFEKEPELQDISGQHPGLANIIRKCTFRDPAKRYQTVKDLLDDLPLYKVKPRAVGATLSSPPTSPPVVKSAAPIVPASRGVRKYALVVTFLGVTGAVLAMLYRTIELRKVATVETAGVVKDLVLRKDAGWAVVDRRLFRLSTSVAEPADPSFEAPFGQSLTGIALDSTGNGWAVGGEPNRPPLLVTFGPGRKTERAAAPSLATHGMFDVALSSANDGWAVGYHGGILKLEHGQWSFENENLTKTQALTAIALTDATNGWAAGYGSNILRLENGRWSRYEGAIAGLTGGFAIRGLALDKNGDGWGVGFDGMILRLVGGSWSLDQQGSGFSDADLIAVVLSPNGDVWASGVGGLLLHNPGSAWERVDHDLTQRNLNAMAFFEDGGGWMASDSLLIRFEQHEAGIGTLLGSVFPALVRAFPASRDAQDEL